MNISERKWIAATIRLGFESTALNNCIQAKENILEEKKN